MDDRSQAEALTRSILKNLRSPIDDGLTVENLKFARKIMKVYGVPARKLYSLVATARLDNKFQANRKDLLALHDVIAGADTDWDSAALMESQPDIMGDVTDDLDKLIYHCEKGLDTLSRHLGTAGASSEAQHEIEKVRDHLEKSYTLASSRADKLLEGSVPERNLGMKLHEHANKTYDLLTALSRDPRANLAERPPLHAKSDKNHLATLSQFTFSRAFDKDQILVPLPKTLYKIVDGSGGGLSEVHAATLDYNGQVNHLLAALAAFQSWPTRPGTLKGLHQAVENANGRSDDLMRQLDWASSRQSALQPKSGDADDVDVDPLGKQKQQVKTQRKELQYLKRLVGQWIDQRNANRAEQAEDAAPDIADDDDDAIYDNPQLEGVPEDLHYEDEGRRAGAPPLTTSTTEMGEPDIAADDDDGDDDEGLWAGAPPPTTSTTQVDEPDIADDDDDDDDVLLEPDGLPTTEEDEPDIADDDDDDNVQGPEGVDGLSSEGVETSKTTKAPNETDIDQDQ